MADLKTWSHGVRKANCDSFSCSCAAYIPWHVLDWSPLNSIWKTLSEIHQYLQSWNRKMGGAVLLLLEALDQYFENFPNVRESWNVWLIWSLGLGEVGQYAVWSYKNKLRIETDERPKHYHGNFVVFCINNQPLPAGSQSKKNKRKHTPKSNVLETQD